MKKINKLFNQIKHYDWGSLSLLPQFLGIKTNRRIPFAEMWMGTHQSAPSQVRKNFKKINLIEISGELPFLFKILAVEKPLSIQVHPNKEQAEEGFERENRAGLSLEDLKRNYKDKNEKSEIICAITPFTLMAADKEITLKPLEALFIPCGVTHSYKSGFGIELMNNSDNVIRGGLTNKHVDTDEFNKITSKAQFISKIITPDASQNVFNYSIPTSDFSLTLIRSKGEKISVSLNTPAICIVIDGKVKIDGSRFKKGDSFFLSKEKQQFTFEGEFILYVASGSNA